MSTGRHAKCDYAEWLRVLHGKVNGTEDPSEARKVELAKDRIDFRPPSISLVEKYADVLVDDEENGNKTMKRVLFGATWCILQELVRNLVRCRHLPMDKYTRN